MDKTHYLVGFCREKQGRKRVLELWSSEINEEFWPEYSPLSNSDVIFGMGPKVQVLFLLTFKLQSILDTSYFIYLHESPLVSFTLPQSIPFVY